MLSKYVVAGKVNVDFIVTVEAQDAKEAIDFANHDFGALMGVETNKGWRIPVNQKEQKNYPKIFSQAFPVVEDRH